MFSTFYVYIWCLVVNYVIQQTSVRTTNEQREVQNKILFLNFHLDDDNTLHVTYFEQTINHEK